MAISMSNCVWLILSLKYIPDPTFRFNDLLLSNGHASICAILVKSFMSPQVVLQSVFAEVMVI